MSNELSPIPHRSAVAISGGLIVPTIVADSGDQAPRRFVEFFTATIRNANTRQAYARAIRDFFAPVAWPMTTDAWPRLLPALRPRFRKTGSDQFPARLSGERNHARGQALASRLERSS